MLATKALLYVENLYGILLPTARQRKIRPNLTLPDDTDPSLRCLPRASGGSCRLAKLEDLQPNLRGIVPDCLVKVTGVQETGVKIVERGRPGASR